MGEKRAPATSPSKGHKMGGRKIHKARKRVEKGVSWRTREEKSPEKGGMKKTPRVQWEEKNLAPQTQKRYIHPQSLI